jgi:hypothetical protein
MDFKNATNEWISIKTQLAAARKDLSTLNTREKELRKFVTQHMQQNEIDTIKVRDKVKVNFKLKKVKGSITKEIIKKGLLTFLVETKPKSRAPSTLFKTPPQLRRSPV